jgi:hypothetical protein
MISFMRIYSTMHPCVLATKPALMHHNSFAELGKEKSCNTASHLMPWLKLPEPSAPEGSNCEPSAPAFPAAVGTPPISPGCPTGCHPMPQGMQLHTMQGSFKASNPSSADLPGRVRYPQLTDSSNFATLLPGECHTAANRLRSISGWSGGCC